MLDEGEPESVLDDPKWLIFGIPEDRRKFAVMRKIHSEAPMTDLNFGGTPWTMPHDPLPQPPPNDYQTPPPAVAAALDLAKVGPDDVLYDLGSGDGVFLIAAAQRGARAVGIETDPDRVWRSREIAKETGLQDRIVVLYEDFHAVDLSGATVIVMNLGNLTPAHVKASPGTRIVTFEDDLRPIVRIA